MSSVGKSKAYSSIVDGLLVDASAKHESLIDGGTVSTNIGGSLDPLAAVGRHVGLPRESV
jgi:hypothetical protein